MESLPKATCLLLLGLALAILLAPQAQSTAKVNITFASLLKNYDTANPPQGFRAYMKKKHGDSNPNTCAVRMAYALFLTNKSFFKPVKAKVEWYGLPVRASELAVILNQRLKSRCIRISSSKEVANKKGIIFFDTIRGYGGSGHISLWNGQQVVDNGDYFNRSPRVYFWQLSD